MFSFQRVNREVKECQHTSVKAVWAVYDSHWWRGVQGNVVALGFYEPLLSSCSKVEVISSVAADCVYVFIHIQCTSLWIRASTKTLKLCVCVGRVVYQWDVGGWFCWYIMRLCPVARLIRQAAAPVAAPANGCSPLSLFHLHGVQEEIIRGISACHC